MNLSFLITHQSPETTIDSLDTRITTYCPMTKQNAANTGRSLKHHYSPQGHFPIGTPASKSNQTTLMKEQNKTLEQMTPKTTTFKSFTFFAKTNMEMLSKEEEKKLEPVFTI